MRIWFVEQYHGQRLRGSCIYCLQLESALHHHPTVDGPQPLGAWCLVGRVADLDCLPCHHIPSGQAMRLSSCCSGWAGSGCHAWLRDVSPNADSNAPPVVL